MLNAFLKILTNRGTLRGATPDFTMVFKRMLIRELPYDKY